MSTALNRLYAQGYRALFELPLEINDHPTSVEFMNLYGEAIVNDGQTEKGDLADTKNLHAAKSPLRAVQVVQRLRPEDQNPWLPKCVYPCDLEVKPGGDYEVRGFDAQGRRSTSAAVRNSVAVSFDTTLSAYEATIRLQGQRSLAAYYLPWKKNHSRVMRLGGGADLFFTSTLTGCTVQVFGSPMSPTVTHTNAGGLQDVEEGQDYMSDLLRLYEQTLGSWEPFGTYDQAQFDRHQYKDFAERNIDRKLARTEGDQPDLIMKEPPAARSVVVGFRDPRSGLWTFYAQSWVRYHYMKVRQRGPRVEAVTKKVIRIKRVSEVWPTPQVLADAWKAEDMRAA